MRKREHYLVYAEFVWLPPWVPRNHGRVHHQARWFLSGVPGHESGIFRLSDFPARYWVVQRMEQVGPRLELPRPTMTDRNMPAYPCVAIVSSDELAALLDQGYAVDVYDGPHWSRDEAHRTLDRFWEDADPRPIRWPSDPVGLRPEALGGAERHYFLFRGEPAMVAGAMALRRVGTEMVAVAPSKVKAEGEEITEAAFNVLMQSPPLGGRHEI